MRSDDVRSDDVLTRHLCFGPLVVDGLAGEGVDSDLGDGHGGIFQLTVEPQDLGPFTRVLHHLDEDKNSPDLDDITGTTVRMFQCKGDSTKSNKFLVCEHFVTGNKTRFGFYPNL